MMVCLKETSTTNDKSFMHNYIEALYVGGLGNLGRKIRSIISNLHLFCNFPELLLFFIFT